MEFIKVKLVKMEVKMLIMLFLLLDMDMIKVLEWIIGLLKIVGEKAEDNKVTFGFKEELICVVLHNVQVSLMLKEILSKI